MLLVGICNHTDYPAGGHLSLVRNILTAFGGELTPAGCSAEGEPVGME